MANKTTKYTLEEIKQKCLALGRIYLDDTFDRVIDKRNVKCVKCNYVYAVKIASLFTNKPPGCPSCSGKKRFSIDDMKQSCSMIGLEFLDADHKHNAEKHNFKCLTCGYVFRVSAKVVTRSKTNCCQRCNGRKLTLEDIQSACSKRAIIFPDQPIANQDNKYNFQCTKCSHTWNATIRNVLGYNLSGCPKCCEGKGERLTRETFERVTGHKFPKVKPLWLINPKTGKKLELDGFCEELKIAFEYQGEQHYRRVRKFKQNAKELEAQQQRDEVKRVVCQQKGIKLIEIPQLWLFMGAEELEPYVLESVGLKDFQKTW